MVQMVARFVSLILIVLAFTAAADTISEQSRIAIAKAALEQVGVTMLYDPSYIQLKYPNGDVLENRGVCADVVVRAFRKVGIDLQVAVHEDMKKNFNSYPRLWGLRRPDKNIDHRRVPNLMKYFERMGKSVPLNSPYHPGDVVAWRLDNGLYHIGIVSSEKVHHENRYYAVHNIGFGTQKEDVLYAFKIIGHYRW